jgi:uncharacterized protein (TIGR01777 family)
VRSTNPKSGTDQLIHWHPDRGTIDAAALEQHDVVVHLAGESLFGIWTPAKKTHIRDSRVRGTTLLARTLAGLTHPPRLLVCASAVGYYGDHPANEPVDETAGPGQGFLASVVVQWEEAAQPARDAGIRVANCRFGIVLSPHGGGLGVMLPIFQAGLGGKLGSGEQVWSWMALPDLTSGIMHVVSSADLSGPINFTTPNAVTNAEFTRVLGRVLGRPTIFTVPEFAMRIALRQMAEEMLLSGVRVLPRKLESSGYAFKHPALEGALRSLLQKPAGAAR